MAKILNFLKKVNLQNYLFFTHQRIYFNKRYINYITSAKKNLFSKLFDKTALSYAVFILRV